MERIEKLKSFLRENSGDSFLKHALALEYVKLGDDMSAREIFEELLISDAAYVGSYYHLGKLFERLGDEAAAIGIYDQGLEVAKDAGDQHAYRELKAAREALSFT
jgi:Tfp pilus assembly protein PilF